MSQIPQANRLAWIRIAVPIVRLLKVSHDCSLLEGINAKTHHEHGIDGVPLRDGPDANG